MTVKSCIVCNKDFKVRNSLVRERKYCSHRCYWDSLKGKPFCDRKQAPMYKNCAVCGKVFEKPYRFNIGRWAKARFCSLQCSGKYHSGEKAPAWKGGKTREQRFARQTHEYKVFRASVLRRDRRMCRECGSTGHLEIHHIKGFTRNPELRFDLNNVITLCVSCHAKTDNYKGRERLTWQQ